MGGRADLVRELKSLRKGRALFAGRLDERVGPELRAVCQVSDGDGSVAIRQKLAARLTEVAEQLPDDLRLCALAAFALITEARLPLYQDRVLWTAMRLDRDSRTVRRRVDEAIEQVAELAAGSPRSPAPAGRWHTTQLSVAVALDQAQPEVLEQHRVVAHEDGLRELDLAASLPAPWRGSDVGVFYGGTLIDRGDAQTSDRFSLALALPGPLDRGESHDVAVRFRLPTAQAMRPYLVCVPGHPCEVFDLRLRFGRRRVPPRVWTWYGAYHRDPSAPPSDGDRRQVDRAGEIHLRFRRLTPGLAYGARWEAEDREPPG